MSRSGEYALSVTFEWEDRSLPWWAKMRRAEKHTEEARLLIHPFKRGEAWDVETAPGRTPNETAHVLKVHHDLNPELPQVVGDVVHNLRSALDNYAFWLAERDHSGSLSLPQEKWVSFPITESAAEFDRFVEHKQRKDLWSSNTVRGLRSVQPFALFEEATAVRVVPAGKLEDEVKSSILYSLRDLSNSDKHRRVPVVVTQVGDLVFWCSNTGDPKYHWAPPEHPPKAEDGAVLGYLRAREGEARPTNEVQYELEVAVARTDGVTLPVLRAFPRWVGSLRGWVIPRVWATSQGFDPPILIPAVAP